MKKVTAVGCANAACLCEPGETQAIRSLLLLFLWLKYVHKNNKTNTDIQVTCGTWMVLNVGLTCSGVGGE